jgi:hypothetical protein
MYSNLAALNAFRRMRGLNGTEKEHSNIYKKNPQKCKDKSQKKEKNKILG